MQRDWPKPLGGLTIMTSVFLFLVVASRFDDAKDGARYVFTGSNDDILTSIVSDQTGTNMAPANVVSGRFDPDLPVEFSRLSEIDGSKIVKFYSSFENESAKDYSGKITLKLETDYNGMVDWIIPETLDFDRADGRLYFHNGTMENDIAIDDNRYTGNYQIILE